MKYQRLIALTLMLFANIFILVHATLPHTHHDGIVCFSIEDITHHCSEESNNIEDCCQCQEKENHHSHSYDDCDLKSFLLRQSDIHDEIIPCEDCLLLFYHLDILQELYLDTFKFGERFREKPYINGYITPYVGSIRSLRAPPMSYFLV